MFISNTMKNNIDRIRKTMLIIMLVIIIVLFLYFGSGTILDGGMNIGMHKNGWMSGNSWKWFSSIGTIVVGVFVGWLLFRKEK